MKTLFHNASILKMDDSPIYFGDLLVEDNRITYIGPDYTKNGPFDRVIECNGNLIMPGFKNAHTHNGMSFLRSKADGSNLHDWLFNEIFPREALMKEEDIYHLGKISILEQLTSGITACLDQYYWPLEHARACKEIGFRLVIQACANKDNDGDKLIELYNSINNEKGLVTYRIGFHAEYTSSEEELKEIQKAIKATKSPYLTHISETQSEVDDCISRRGMTPVQYFDSLGLFDYGGVCYHSIYLTEDDIEIFKKKHIAVVTCPGSNLKLASGICPVNRYLDEGLLIGIGTDGPSSNNCLDMFKEMSLVINLAKIKTNNPNALSAYEVLKMATVNGAKILGLDDCDTLEVGKLADIIEIDLSRPNMQPINNVVDNLVNSGSKDNIKLTMINGKVLYEDGKFFVNQDIEEIYDKVQEIGDRIDKQLLGE